MTTVSVKTFCLESVLHNTTNAGSDDSCPVTGGLWRPLRLTSDNYNDSEKKVRWWRGPPCSLVTVTMDKLGDSGFQPIFLRVVSSDDKANPGWKWLLISLSQYQIPFREPKYPTWGEGKSSSKVFWEGICYSSSQEATILSLHSFCQNC